MIQNSLWSSHLRTNKHKNKATYKSLQDGVEIINSAFNKRIVTYKISPKGFVLQFKIFFQEVLTRLLLVWEEEVLKHVCVKTNIEVFGYYYNPSNDQYDVKSFNTPFKIICSSSNFKEIAEEMFQIIDTKADAFAERDSGEY